MSQTIEKIKIENDIAFAANKSEGEKWKEKVLKTIYDILWRKKSLYRELFYFHPNTLTFKQLQKKALFKLKKIIEIECKDSPFYINILPEKDQRDSSTKLIDENDVFFMKIKIDLVNKEITESFNTTFIWINKQKLDLNFNKITIVDKAIKKIGEINKKSFFEFANGNQANLMLFLQGMLQNISPEFTIKYLGKNINSTLKTPLESEFIVQFQNKDMFSFLMEIDEVDFLNKNQNKERWKVRNIPLATYVTNKRRTAEKWKFVAQALRIKFAKMWNYSDSLYEFVKTVKHLFSMLYGDDFANAISITTSFPLKTKLIDLKYEQKNQKGLNFQWFFNSYNFKLSIFNMEFNTVQLDFNQDNYKI